MNSKIINIPPLVQRKGRLCWAACIEMVIKTPSIGLSHSQQEICLERYNCEKNDISRDVHESEVDKESALEEINEKIRNLDNSRFCNVISPDDSGVFPSLDSEQKDYENIFTNYSISQKSVKGGFMLKDSIKSQIEKDQCLILSNVSVPNIPSHALLIIGYLEKDSIFHISVNDPYIYYNYPENTFKSCEVSTGGRACYVYQNLYFSNNKFKTGNKLNILTLSNFNKNASLNNGKVSSEDLEKPKAFSTLQNALNEFDANFLLKIYGFQPNLSINPTVRCFSIDYANGTNYQNYQKKVCLCLFLNRIILTIITF